MKLCIAQKKRIYGFVRHFVLWQPDTLVHGMILVLLLFVNSIGDHSTNCLWTIPFVQTNTVKKNSVQTKIQALFTQDAEQLTIGQQAPQK